MTWLEGVIVDDLNGFGARTWCFNNLEWESIKLLPLLDDEEYNSDIRFLTKPELVKVVGECKSSELKWKSATLKRLRELKNESSVNDLFMGNVKKLRNEHVTI